MGLNEELHDALVPIEGKPNWALAAELKEKGAILSIKGIQDLINKQDWQYDYLLHQGRLFHFDIKTRDYWDPSEYETKNTIEEFCIYPLFAIENIISSKDEVIKYQKELLLLYSIMTYNDNSVSLKDSIFTYLNKSIVDYDDLKSFIRLCSDVNFMPSENLRNIFLKDYMERGLINNADFLLLYIKLSNDLKQDPSMEDLLNKAGVDIFNGKIKDLYENINGLNANSITFTRIEGVPNFPLLKKLILINIRHNPTNIYDPFINVLNHFIVSLSLKMNKNDFNFVVSKCINQIIVESEGIMEMACIIKNYSAFLSQDQQNRMLNIYVTYLLDKAASAFLMNDVTIWEYIALLSSNGAQLNADVQNKIAAAISQFGQELSGRVTTYKNIRLAKYPTLNNDYLEDLYDILMAKWGHFLGVNGLIIGTFTTKPYLTKILMDRGMKTSIYDIYVGNSPSPLSDRWREVQGGEGVEKRYQLLKSEVYESIEELFSDYYGACVLNAEDMKNQIITLCAELMRRNPEKSARDLRGVDFYIYPQSKMLLSALLNDTDFIRWFPSKGLDVFYNEIDPSSIILTEILDPYVLDLKKEICVNDVISMRTDQLLDKLSLSRLYHSEDMLIYLLLMWKHKGEHLSVIETGIRTSPCAPFYTGRVRSTLEAETILSKTDLDAKEIDEQIGPLVKLEDVLPLALLYQRIEAVEAIMNKLISSIGREATGAILVSSFFNYYAKLYTSSYFSRSMIPPEYLARIFAMDVPLDAPVGPNRVSLVYAAITTLSPQFGFYLYNEMLNIKGKDKGFNYYDNANGVLSKMIQITDGSSPSSWDGLQLLMSREEVEANKPNNMPLINLNENTKLSLKQKAIIIEMLLKRGAVLTSEVYTRLIEIALKENDDVKLKELYNRPEKLDIHYDAILSDKSIEHQTKIVYINKLPISPEDRQSLQLELALYDGDLSLAKMLYESGVRVREKYIKIIADVAILTNNNVGALVLMDEYETESGLDVSGIVKRVVLTHEISKISTLLRIRSLKKLTIDALVSEGSWELIFTSLFNFDISTRKVKDESNPSPIIPLRLDELNALLIEAIKQDNPVAVEILIFEFGAQRTYDRSEPLHIACHAKTNNSPNEIIFQLLLDEMIPGDSPSARAMNPHCDPRIKGFRIPYILMAKYAYGAFDVVFRALLKNHKPLLEKYNIEGYNVNIDEYINAILNAKQKLVFKIVNERKALFDVNAESSTANNLSERSTTTFENAVKPNLQLLFDSYPGSDDIEKIESIEIEIRYRLLESIISECEDSINEYDIISSNLALNSQQQAEREKLIKLRKFVGENIDKLKDAYNKENMELLHELNSLGGSNEHIAQIAFRVYNPYAPHDFWINQLTRIEYGANPSSPNDIIPSAELRERSAYYYLATTLLDNPKIKALKDQLVREESVEGTESELEINTRELKTKQIAFLESTPPIQFSAYRGLLASIRRAHNDGGQIEDSPSCVGGSKGRIGKMGQDHPIFRLPPDRNEIILDTVSPIITERFRVVANEWPWAKFQKLYSIITKLTFENAEFVLSEPEHMTTEDEAKLKILQEFIGGCGTIDELVQKVETRFAKELNEPGQQIATQTDRRMVEYNMLDIHGNGRADLLNAIYERKYNQMMKAPENPFKVEYINLAHMPKTEGRRAYTVSPEIMSKATLEHNKKHIEESLQKHVHFELLYKIGKEYFEALGVLEEVTQQRVKDFVEELVIADVDPMKAVQKRGIFEKYKEEFALSDDDIKELKTQFQKGGLFSNITSEKSEAINEIVDRLKSADPQLNEIIANKIEKLKETYGAPKTATAALPLKRKK